MYTLMTTNTDILDTKYFWDLSKNIFRYSHLSVPNGVSVGVHGVNEGMPSSWRIATSF